MNTEHKQLRELSPSEIEEILRRCSHAHLGCSRGGEIIWGRFQELKNGTEAERGLRLLKMKICEILQRRDVTPLEVELEAILSEAKIYRINIDRISGRAERLNTEGVSQWNQNLVSSSIRLP